MRYLFFFICVLFVSCSETEKERIGRLVNEWSDKEVVFPENSYFVSLNKDTMYLPKSEYTIVTYVDSIGCTSCKLKLMEWRRLIAQVDSANNTSVLFFLHPKDEKEIVYALRRDNFTYPVCIDEKDTFNKLNKLPHDEMFQTFLLDKNNKVVAIGNPVHNPKVKELYLKIIMGDKAAPQKEVKIQTSVMCSNSIVDMGKFDWHQEQKATFTLTNTGNSPLVVTDVITSCGCTTVDYGKEPVRPEKSLELKVQYKADHPEHFDKTITVYCNTETSPIKLRITGNAE